MRTRAILAATFVSVCLVGMSAGAMATAAVPTTDPTPSSTGQSQVGFTVGGTATPTPVPSGGTGGSGGSGGGTGGSGGGGTPPPKCVPSTKTPPLSASPATTAATLKLTPHTVSQGQDVLVQGDGFKPSEKVVIALYSKPVDLGTFTVRTNGQVYAQVTIPKKTQLGGHTIQVTGYTDCHIAAGSIDVVSPHGSGTSIFPWIVWLVAGGSLLLAAIGIVFALMRGWLPAAAVGGTAVKVGP